MQKICLDRKGFFSLIATTVLLIGGCGQAQNKSEKNKESNGKKKELATQAESGHSFKGRDWCAEHGLPESVCSMCDANVAAEFKKKKDWCEEHDRAMTQCFKCKKELKTKFAAEYKAMYGEDPPPTE